MIFQKKKSSKSRIIDIILFENNFIENYQEASWVRKNDNSAKNIRDF